jgi:hypothetical protein
LQHVQLKLLFQARLDKERRDDPAAAVLPVCQWPAADESIGGSALSPGAKIQMLDLPGIIEGAKDGKGRGRQVISTARTCNLILIVLDCLKPLTHKKVCGVWRSTLLDGRLQYAVCDVAIATHYCICTPPRRQSGRSSKQVSASICKFLHYAAAAAADDDHGDGDDGEHDARLLLCCSCLCFSLLSTSALQLIEHELEGFGIRLNKKPPNITFKKKDKGGINFTSNAQNGKLDLEAVKAVCAEYRCDGLPAAGGVSSAAEHCPP